MTTTADDVDLDLPLSLTFGGADDLPIDRLGVTMLSLSSLCISAYWLVNYENGRVPEPWFLDVLAEDEGLQDPEYFSIGWHPGLGSPDRYGNLMWSLDDPNGAPEWLKPRVQRLSKQSPLLIDLAFNVGPYILTAPAVGLIIRALKNPDRIGGYIPSLAASWREGRVRALRAQIEEQTLRTERDQALRSLGDPNDSVDWFTLRAREQEYYWRLGADSPHSPGPINEERFQALDDAADEQARNIHLQAGDLRVWGLTAIQGEDLPNPWLPGK